MQITKRSGRKEDMKFDKISNRIRSVCKDLSSKIDPIKITQKVIEGLYDGVSTIEIDRLIAETCASMVTNHPDYGQLASNITISSLHKQTPSNFTTAMKRLYENLDDRGNHKPLVSETFLSIVKKNSAEINKKINYDLDFTYDYFGISTLMRAYLLGVKSKIVERPQHMLMRVAIGIWGDNLEKAFKTYDMMSKKKMTHATPTLFNSGTPVPQMSSCFLIANKEDSINGIYDTLKECAQISQAAGGIGLHIHNVRATDAPIRGVDGASDGLVPMLRVYNDTARYVNQLGKRKGSFAIYLEPWHADVMDFLDLKKNHGAEDRRARDLFYAMWIPDLFMKRVMDDGDWTLMCPYDCPNLSDVYDEKDQKAFTELYESYEKENKGRKTIKARELWEKILESQIETGTPYMLYKDAANQKSNQKNIGVIKSSNLCTEIMEVSTPDETAVCNLASIALPAFVKFDKDDKVYFDWDELMEVVDHTTKSLNQVIDLNYYPTEATKKSNLRHRPIGLGVQGLADVYMMMNLPFESDLAKVLNKNIFEVIYYAALKSSMEVAKDQGAYETFEGSPISKGIFQWQMWDVKEEELSGLCDWKKLRKDIQKYGVRNSLTTAPMPTASTAQILGNNEAFEPYTANLYTRRVLSGEFMVINKHLINDLIERDLWNEDMKYQLMADNGSVMNLPIDTDLKELYKTVWEMKMKNIIDMSADRAPFIDQSQSLNLFMEGATIAKLSSMHSYAWKKGLKTGMYYLRTKSAVDAKKFTVDANLAKNFSDRVKEGKPKIEIEPMSVDDFKARLMASQNGVDDDDCLMCGS